MERTNGGTNNKDGGHESADAAEQQETPELGLRLRAAHGCLVGCLALCLLTDGRGRGISSTEVATGSASASGSGSGSGAHYRYVVQYR